jgi:hypothetical protein
MQNIKLYKVVKTKSAIHGLWQADGKTYRDFIEVIACKDYETLTQGIQALFAIGEKAVFYSINGVGYCKYNDGKIEIFPHRAILTRDFLTIKSIKSLLKKYGGMTIYKVNTGIKAYSLKTCYEIEIYKTI